MRVSPAAAAAAGRCLSRLRPLSIYFYLFLCAFLDSHQIKDEANQCIVAASGPAAHCLAKLIASLYLYGQVKIVMKLLWLHVILTLTTAHTHTHVL